ncbi:SCP domain-containing protein [Caenorhabditis elegans]|uniref:SCP domain-containing protein n=1 Tax=Caenorhabditis elegans TaxID=6239 RepID=Q9XWP2_CAEEL|nr:SCP domain-containing protein [Caenorhabditis elegans]CAA21609.1 SCP domain-containing protein [Caenorhabditis elegans]|eukprot:NP_507805.1 Uncharacterized protein CELE_Y43F8C.5 [Caenorhabditis elegans]
MTLVLVLTILIALQHATAVDTTIEQTTPKPKWKMLQEQFDKEVEQHFLRLNDYRREVAKMMNWSSMNELKYGDFNVSDGSNSFYYSTTNSFKEVVNNLIYWANNIVDDLKENKTICEDDEDCFGAYIINPMYKSFKSSLHCGASELEPSSCDEPNAWCYFYPRSNVTWKATDQQIGEPGFACDADRYNKNGLCSLDPPTTTTTTTTTTTVKPPPPTTTPKSSDSSANINILVFCIVSITTYLWSY